MKNGKTCKYKYLDPYGFSFVFCSVYIYPNISAVSIGLYLQPAARVFGGTVYVEIWWVVCRHFSVIFGPN